MLHRVRAWPPRTRYLRASHLAGRTQTRDDALLRLRCAQTWTTRVLLAAHLYALAARCACALRSSRHRHSLCGWRRHAQAKTSAGIGDSRRALLPRVGIAASAAALYRTTHCSPHRLCGAGGAAALHYACACRYLIALTLSHLIAVAAPSRWCAVYMATAGISAPHACSCRGAYAGLRCRNVR